MFGEVIRLADQQGEASTAGDGTVKIGEPKRIQIDAGGQSGSRSGHGGGYVASSSPWAERAVSGRNVQPCRCIHERPGERIAAAISQGENSAIRRKWTASRTGRGKALPGVDPKRVGCCF